MTRTRDPNNPQKIRVYEFVKQYIHRNKFSPTLREIGNAVLSRGKPLSTSVASWYLDQLAEDGLIKKMPGLARSVLLVNAKDSSRSDQILDVLRPFAEAHQKGKFVVSSNALRKADNLYRTLLAEEPVGIEVHIPARRDELVPA